MLGVCLMCALDDALATCSVFVLWGGCWQEVGDGIVVAVMDEIIVLVLVYFVFWTTMEGW